MNDTKLTTFRDLMSCGLVDALITIKPMEGTMKTMPINAAPENRAEVILHTDLLCRRRARDELRGQQRNHEKVAKNYKMDADRHAKAVKELEAVMKKASFDIPEDAGK